MIEAVDERECDETATRLGELPEPVGNPDALDCVCDRARVGMGGESACRFVEQGRSLIGLALSGDGHEDVAGERRSILLVEKPTTEGENCRAVDVKGLTDVDGLVFECRVRHGSPLIPKNGSAALTRQRLGGDFRPIRRRSNTARDQNSDAASCNAPRKYVMKLPSSNSR